MRPTALSIPARLIALALVVSPIGASAQSYYDLDAGRPTRVEDATPAARYELNVQALPVRFEQLATGARRWRSDTKLAYGVAPFTELELRVPFLIVDAATSGEPIVAGVAGVAVGGLRALTVETGWLPGVAVAAEWVAPVGGLAASYGSYSAKGIVTKTFRLLRLHANAGFGTWSVRAPPRVAPGCPSTTPPGTVIPPGCPSFQPTIPDTPCDRVPSNGAAYTCLPSPRTTVEAATRSMNAQSDTLDGRLLGPRYMAAVGFDHAFALSSTLITADFVAERYVHLLRTPDLLAEIGVRHQWTPQIVLDVGVGRHFSGPVRSNTVTLGVSYDLSMGQSEARSREDR